MVKNFCNIQCGSGFAQVMDPTGWRAGENLGAIGWRRCAWIYARRRVRGGKIAEIGGVGGGG